MSSSASPISSTASLHVVDLDPSRDPRWDEFLRHHPSALVYHHSGWLRSLEREYEQPTIALACQDSGGRLHGILPLMVTRGLPFGLGGAAAGPRLASLPRTPLAGPLATSDAALRVLLGSSIDRAEAERVRLQLKVAEPSLGGLDGRLVGTEWRLTYVRDLPDDPERLRFGNSRNHARIRWAVGRAQREGIEVRAAETEEDLREWFRLYLDVNRWRGQPSRPYRLFKATWDLLRPLGMMRLLLAERRAGRRREMVAGSMLLMLGSTVFYAFNGRDRDALAQRPNDILQWHAMRDASVAGFRSYDFGEVETVNDGLATFKAKWGTEARRLYRYHAPPVPSDEAGYGALESRSWIRRAGLAAWHRVPLPATAFVGDRMYRYL